MYIFRSVFYLFIITVLASACSSNTTEEEVAKEPSDPKRDSLLLVYNPAKADKKLDEYFKGLHRKRNFNGNVLVAKKGKIIYEGTFGWADYLHRDSLKIKSQFQLASVSKPITGTAVLMLIEQGKLKLSDTVDQFFPDFPYKGITIEMLLSHRSGLNNYVYFSDDIWKEKYNELVPEINSLIKRIVNLKELPHT